ncbi:TraR/DksA family transcriptional regulator [uncultured Jatrophihabitans sp.]|uniref:TraR/DksA family transcriptional regulator n=1 Tax=uncultured Jatrophihabitans sp. TaxID=1610747 RepID=UPI0035CADE59
MTRTAYPPRPDFIESMRRTLVAQRDFRREQLAHLDRQRDGRALSGAHREVYVSLAVGARIALQDAQSALWRIEHGRFGLCVRCGDELDLEVLETLPQTARCLACQRTALDSEEARAQPTLQG